MRHYNKSQTDEDKVSNNGCYLIFILITFASKVTLLQLPFFLDISFAKRRNYLLERNFEEN